jgi:hypothetical protein
MNIEPKTLEHSKWLWDLAQNEDRSAEERKRLREIAVLMQYRPDINMKGDFQFEVGKTYLTRGGKLVKIINKTDTKGYECVQGNDMNPETGYRYSRSTGTADQGRCTGSPGDSPNNLLPIEVIDPRIS